MEKRFLTADSLVRDGFSLALRVLESGWRPDHLVGLWRGGCPVAIALHEALAFKGVKIGHSPLAAHSYTGIDERKSEIAISGLDALTAVLPAGSKLLVVDDVLDRGHTLAAVLDALKGRYEVRTAVAWYKPKRNETTIRPDYHVHETDDWLVFPHELEGLTEEEIAAHKPVPDGFV
ncbi:putative phosphoribosyltransferase [Glycocaulis alkaliphilus]|uniref:Putative phosphoribosyltransferase n=1 Tax=Glycocaulis alkaliphilus TaxID=1434191 RepID=A0A3T0E9W2_9PROT|nr:phosphoribosyltransferase family protein [Glycocaulis alkaliphilus]AZU04017.1 putative phosphoribosyltransferase [Glycocaulis alkaliphilus]GGB75119.1 hypoxanthine phosphoribosyltransferase [Glycocaulis alkaliphilus]